jgi:hypothetical protein
LSRTGVTPSRPALSRHRFAAQGLHGLPQARPGRGSASG